MRRELEQTQWLPAEEIKSLQVRRLRVFLTQIGAEVPYYQELFRSLDFQPESVATLEDLQKLPLLGKPEIRANTELMKSNLAGPLERFTTGGSTGEPLIFYRGKERVSRDVAAKWRATRTSHSPKMTPLAA